MAKVEEKCASKPNVHQPKERCKTYVDAIASKPSDFLKIGQIMDNRYRVVCKLSEGLRSNLSRRRHFELFEHLSVGRIGAKNRTDRRRSTEHGGCRDDQVQELSELSEIFRGGKVNEFYHFVVTQLLGKNLTELGKACQLKPSRLSLSATVRLLTQCVRSLEGLHNVGFLHRDIKPSNFTMGAQKEDENRVYLLDFGLARFYGNHDRTVRPARAKAGFRGTVRYAAITAHDNAELSRRDDLWSLFYMYFEMLVGELPWSQMTDRKTVGQMKRHHSPEALSQWIPQETGVYVQYVRKLRYEDKPDYDGVADGFAKVIKRLNIKEIDKFDWQLDSCKQLKHWTVTEDCKKC